MRSLPTRHKVLASFGALLLVSLATGVTAFWSGARVRSKLLHMANESAPSLEALGSARDGHDRAMRGVNALFICDAPKELREPLQRRAR